MEVRRGMPSGARAGPSSDPEREKAKKREAKKSQTQKLYELLVPKSSTGGWPVRGMPVGDYAVP